MAEVIKYLKNFYVFDPKVVDADKCRTDARRIAKTTGKDVGVHFHKHREKCNERCEVYTDV